jgi:hypothetical protein
VLCFTQNLTLDPLVYVRTQTLSFVFCLLREKPEQEHNLLRLLVNKLVRYPCVIAKLLTEGGNRAILSAVFVPEHRTIFFNFYKCIPL